MIKGTQYYYMAEDGDICKIPEEDVPQSNVEKAVYSYKQNIISIRQDYNEIVMDLQKKNRELMAENKRLKMSIGALHEN